MRNRFRRRHLRRRRFRSRTPFRPRKMARYIRKTVRRMSELKWQEDQIASQTIAVGWNIFDLTPSITQGASRNQRIGDKIQTKGCYLQIAVNNTTVIQNLSYRLIICTSASGLPITSSDFPFGSTTTTWLGTLDPSKLHVFRDVKLEIPSETAGNNPNIKHLKYYFPLKYKIDFRTGPTSTWLDEKKRLILAINPIGAIGNSGLIFATSRWGYYDI